MAQELIDVEMPDGTIIEGVPKGITKAELQAKLDRYNNKPQERSMMDEVGRQLGLTARYITEGVTSLPGVVGNAANEATNYGIRGVNRLLGTDIQQLRPVTQEVSSLLDQIGLPKPQGGLERVVGDVSTAMAAGGGQAQIASRLAAAPSGAQGILRQLAANPAVQVQAAAGAGLGGGLARESGAGPVGQLAGSVVGGIAVPAAIRSVSPAPASVKADAKAASAISKAAKQSGMSPDDLMKELDRIGPDATLSDLNDTLLRQARTVYTVRGTGAEAVKSNLERRAAQMTTRTVNDLKKITGKDTNFFDTVQSTIAARKAQTKPLYAEADRAAVSPDSIKSLHKQILDKAKEAEGTRLAGSLNRFAAMLKSGEGFKTNLKQLDIVKRQVRDIVSRSYRSGDNDTARNLDDMLKVLSNSKGTGILEKSSSAYREANKIFSDESSVLSALESGKKVLSSDADEIAANLKSLSLAERDAYMQGAVKAIRDKILAGGRLSSDLIKERMRNVFDSDASFNKFMKVLEREQQFSQTKNAVLGGSQTTNKAADLVEQAKDIASSAAFGGVRGVALSAASKVLKASPNIPERLREPLARMLTTPEGGRRAIQIMKRSGMDEMSIAKLLSEIKQAQTGTAAGIASQQ